MKRKKLSFSVHSEDIRPIASNVVSLILGRFSANYTSTTQDLNVAAQTGDNVTILENLQHLVDVFNEAIKEIEMCSDLIECIEPIKVEKEEPKKKTSQD